MNIPTPLLQLVVEVVAAILSAQNPSAAAKRALAAARHRAVVEAVKKAGKQLK